jgi:cation transporter-like permease
MRNALRYVLFLVFAPAYLLVLGCVIAIYGEDTASEFHEGCASFFAGLE